jgi:hypothetical protein
VRLPRTIGRFEFVELLGAGGGGSVYAAKQRGELGISVDVAVKLLREGPALAELGGLDAFHDEARLLSRIDHPNVVRIREFTVLRDDELGEVPALVMDRVSGVTLAALLRRLRDAGRVLPLPAVVHFMQHALDALGHVHYATDESGRPLGVVHRDIKPGNFMLTVEGEIRILDFGIAWAAERLAQSAVGVLKGTVRYLSPEQLAGLALDGRSDLYALGTVAFEMITGEPFVSTGDAPAPHTAQLLGALLQTRLVSRLPSLRRALDEWHGCSASDTEMVCDALLRLLQHDRDGRFPHARAAAAALEPLAARWSPWAGRKYFGWVARGEAEEGPPGGPFAPRREPTARARGHADDSAVASRSTTGLRRIRDEAAALTGPLAAAAGLTLGLLILAVLVAGGVLRTEAPAGEAEDQLRPAPVGDGRPSGQARTAPAGTPGAGVVGPAPAVVPLGVDSPELWLAHDMPRWRPDRREWQFLVLVHGRGGTCTPELQLRPTGSGGVWTRRALRGGGGFERWWARLGADRIPSGSRGVDYWIPCRDKQGAVVASWRSENRPGWLDAGD